MQSGRSVGGGTVLCATPLATGQVGGVHSVLPESVVRGPEAAQDGALQTKASQLSQAFVELNKRTAGGSEVGDSTRLGVRGRAFLSGLPFQPGKLACIASPL